MESLLAAIAQFAISTGPSLLMLAAFALAIAGVLTIRKGENRQKGVLMLICAAVFFANVLIWTL